MRVITMFSIFIFAVILMYASGPVAAQTIDCSYVCNPASGTVPFTVNMMVTITNNVLTIPRRAAARIDVYLDIFQVCDGDTHTITNWRAGYTNIAPGDTYMSGWNQNIPAVRKVIGTDQFVLSAEDVTPAPYNQPPYPQSGNACFSVCEIVANGNCD